LIYLCANKGATYMVIYMHIFTEGNNMGDWSLATRVNLLYSPLYAAHSIRPKISGVLTTSEVKCFYST
jgi:hypothetical protein